MSYFSLRDAAGRDMIPNRMQPGAANLSGGGSVGALFENTGGAQAYDEFPSYGGFAPVGGPPQMPQPDSMANYSTCSSCVGGGGGSNFGSGPVMGTNGTNQMYGGGGGEISRSIGGNFRFPDTYQDLVRNLDAQAYSGGVSNRTAHLPKIHQTLNQQIVNNLRKNILLVTKELGVTPNWVDLSPDGGAVWKFSRMVRGKSIWCRVFNRIEVHAERRAGKKPWPFIGAVTTTTKVKLDCDLIKELQREMPQLGYCPSTNKLTITMDTLPHNLSLLALVCACQQGKINVNKLCYYKLPQKYLGLTTPGHRRYKSGAKYSLIRFIKSKPPKSKK